MINMGHYEALYLPVHSAILVREREREVPMWQIILYQMGNVRGSSSLVFVEDRVLKINKWRTSWLSQCIGQWRKGGPRWTRDDSRVQDESHRDGEHSVPETLRSDPEKQSRCLCLKWSYKQMLGKEKGLFSWFIFRNFDFITRNGSKRNQFTDINYLRWRGWTLKIISIYWK